MALSKNAVYALLKAEGLTPTEKYAHGHTAHRFWVNKAGDEFAVTDEDGCCEPEILANIIAASRA